MGYPFLKEVETIRFLKGFADFFKDIGVLMSPP